MQIKDITIIILLAILIVSNIIFFASKSTEIVSPPDIVYVTKIDTVCITKVKTIYVTKVKTVVDSTAIKAAAFLDQIVTLQLDYIEALQEDLANERNKELHKPITLEPDVHLE